MALSRGDRLRLMLRNDPSDARIKLAVQCFFVILIINISLLANSFDTIEPLEVGLKYNKFTKEVHPETYTSGRYYVGVGKKFITRTNQFQTAEFSNTTGRSVRMRTQDGLAVVLEFAFQYRIQPDKYYELFTKFLNHLDGPPIIVAKDVVFRAGSEWNSRDYWLRRNDVATDMMTKIRNSLEPLGYEVMLLTLLHFEVPPAYDEAIIQTQVEQQLIKTRRMEKDLTEVHMLQKQISNQAEANSTVITASAEAASYVEINEGRATAKGRMLQAEASSFGKAQDSLNFKEPGSVNQYYWLQNIAPEATVMVGIQPKPILRVLGGSGPSVDVVKDGN